MGPTGRPPRPASRCRNPAAAALVPAVGSPFYKPELGNLLPIACLPVPFAEKANNPNF